MFFIKLHTFCLFSGYKRRSQEILPTNVIHISSSVIKHLNWLLSIDMPMNMVKCLLPCQQPPSHLDLEDPTLLEKFFRKGIHLQVQKIYSKRLFKVQIRLLWYQNLVIQEKIVQRNQIYSCHLLTQTLKTYLNKHWNLVQITGTHPIVLILRQLKKVL